MNVLKIKQMQTGGLRKGLKLKVDKKTVRKRYKCMAFLRKQGYNARGKKVLLKEGTPTPEEHKCLAFLMEQGYCIMCGEIS